jgi:hypothetical protein
LVNARLTIPAYLARRTGCLGKPPRTKGPLALNTRALLSFAKAQAMSATILHRPVGASPTHGSDGNVGDHDGLKICVMKLRRIGDAEGETVETQHRASRRHRPSGVARFFHPSPPRLNALVRYVQRLAQPWAHRLPADTDARRHGAITSETRRDHYRDHNAPPKPSLCSP